MHYAFLAVLYLMFFLSGAAALVYQVVWVRSLTLIFGGSHLAVTVVLAVFMAGLAIGGYVLGKYADRAEKPLRLYGMLELGIALAAVLFAGLMKLYPSIYVPLAQGRDDAPVLLTGIRVLFAAGALIIPTTLMGGTLPVLSKFIARRLTNLRNHLSFLYGFNTLGAVLGAVAAGFFLLRLFSQSTTLVVAIATNAVIGIVSILLQDRAENLLSAEPGQSARREAASRPEPVSASPQDTAQSTLPFTLVLWGIGVSGFCALGYEVLWTRTLTVVVGASVYGFTIMLVAFLAGIALGSGAYGLAPKLFHARDLGAGRAVLWFGAVQVVIGVTALVVTAALRHLPLTSIGLQQYFAGWGMEFFAMRLWSNFLLAFLFMLVPAFFMGLAFPLAGRIHAERIKTIGSAVGEVLAYNTGGAILGAAVSGFVLLYLFGIERSLQMLSVVNIGFGALVVLSLRGSRAVNLGAAGVTVAVLLFLGINHHALRVWDMKYFAVFRNNQPEAFRTPEMVRDAVENTDVLYYAEGAEAIVSSIKVRGGDQAFLTNGRIEASSQLQGQQCQYALGHLPMLLNRHPKRVLVVGAGSGMTLGATAAHPGVEQVTLAEIEPAVLGVTRTFARYNHRVLDDPKLRIVFNDGRNFLLTTKDTFDVITADPIHPWFRGAGYLYTAEYFKLVSEHLNPGGIACQWLPLYELTPANMKSVVRTFQEVFPYTMVWLTHYDAELVGSNEPILIDEADLERRIAAPGVSEDLRRVMMGSAEDLLSYFAMGPAGAKALGRDGIVNTDDNLYLEFSAPFSIGVSSVMEANINTIVRHRESVLPYLIPRRDRERQQRMWDVNDRAFGITGRALALFLGGKTQNPEFLRLMHELDRSNPRFAPARFLKNEYLAERSKEPTLIATTTLVLAGDRGTPVRKEIAAVLVRVSSERAAVMFVDNDERVIYGQLYISGPGNDAALRRFAADVMEGIQAAYRRETEIASRRNTVPSAGPVLRSVKDIIDGKIREINQRQSPSQKESHTKSKV